MLISTSHPQQTDQVSHHMGGADQVVNDTQCVDSLAAGVT